MIKVIVIIYLFLINLIQAEDLYEYTISILWKQDSFKLADGSSFNSYTLNDGYFFDNQGNLINLNLTCQITEKSGDQFWSRSYRKDTDLKGELPRLKFFLQPVNLLI